MTNKNKATVGLFCFLLAVVIPGEAKDPAPLPNIDAASPANNTDRNKAKNCDIKIAPKDALRYPLDGDTLATLHYPDPRSVPDDYSGCLNIWFEAGGRAFLTAVARFEKGQLVSLTDPERNMGCHYDNGRLIKEKSVPAELCPPSGGTVSEWKTDKSAAGGIVRLPVVRARDKRSIPVQESLDKATEPTKVDPLPFEKMRAAVYSKEFAKRFALPHPEPGTEPSGGVQAMEFAVESSSNAPYYYCKLYLYLDNKLPIAYPEGETGVAYLPSRRTQLMTFDAQTRWLRLSEKDRQYFNERKGRYTRSAVLATPNYEWHKQGMFADMFYEEYHRDLFPNLAYVRLDMGCPTAQWGERYPEVQVWLKKEGAKDYRYIVRNDPDAFLKFPIPDVFFKKIAVWIKEAARYNSTVIDRKADQKRGNQLAPSEQSKTLPDTNN